jgi:hypothetical protein
MTKSFPQILLTLATFVALLLSFATAPAKDPAAFSIPEDSRSPDGHYGVTVPTTRDDDVKLKEEPKNQLVEIKSGRAVATIEAWTGWSKMNHGGVLPARWSRDGSLLLWEVDGKWCPHALVLLKLEKGQLQWQCNVLQVAQQALLERTRKAAPEKYAAAKKANAGNGSAYPEGFTIDVKALDPVTVPLRVEAVLTANPKGIEDHANLDSHLEGVIDAAGTLKVTSFKLGRREWDRF